MTFRHTFSHSIVNLAVCGNSCAVALATPLVLNPGTYDISATTLLPHLEENMRYASTRQRHCLGTQDATTLFPILRHEALAGCALTNGQTMGELHEYTITCSKPGTATGTARLTVSPAALRGVVEIKLGGKNMTLSQRINGTRLGVCGESKEVQRSFHRRSLKPTTRQVMQGKLCQQNQYMSLTQRPDIPGVK